MCGVKRGIMANYRPFYKMRQYRGVKHGLFIIRGQSSLEPGAESSY